MLHWTPFSQVSPALEPLARTSRPMTGVRVTLRGDHARMLAHAALRRRRALGEDGDYWKACAPAAVAKAIALRGEGGFAALP